jgi:uncharacterized protein (TIGR00255 family)
MIKSMTGFGRSELKSPLGFIRVEIKTTNHKFLEISSRLPLHLSEFEDSVRKQLSNELRRGKISLFVSSPDPAVYSTKLVLNEPLAKEIFEKIKRLQTVLKIKSHGDSLILNEVLRYPDVLTRDSASGGRGEFSKILNRAISLALVNLAKSKSLEGKALEIDFKKRMAEIKKALFIIEKRIPILRKEYKKHLETKMKEFLKTGQVDAERLTLEVALYVKNSDISEEVTRLKSHLNGMTQALKESGELGRKIDFIAQEMNREANTMGAKSSDVTIANSVIQIKSTIEKIREQAQNVE